MKQKIIIFITGLLLGAIISTSSIYVYTIANSNNNQITNGKGPSDMMNGNPPEMPNNNQTNSQGTNWGAIWKN